MIFGEGEFNLVIGQCFILIFSWAFLFCLVSVCSAGSPTSVDVESHVQICSSSFCLYCKQWWMASFSSPGKKTAQHWFPVRLFSPLKAKSLGQLLKPHILLALLCRCGGTVLLTRCSCMRAQKNSPSVCSRVAFPPESTKDIVQIACFHPQRKETKEKKTPRTSKVRKMCKVMFVKFFERR